MAYNAKNLSVLAYANGFTLWHYATPDTGNAVDTAGYFNDAADMIRAGDVILANTETGGAAKAGLLLVSANSGGVVDTNDMTQIGATDTR
ncbi:MAG: hypothetical protein FJX37_07150 [Alphaproteobacteria bacterium]|nr:hypothetical protein [Alphaproteobacteria bacterium]MBM3951791.1 hypothetical protein [Rhodospirillales bacterium]